MSHNETRNIVVVCCYGKLYKYDRHVDIAGKI